MSSNEAQEIEQFVMTIARALVDHPEDVEITLLESGNMVVVELTTAKSDTGKVIGREGRMAQSLRILVTALSTKLRKKAVLQILER
jgi:uncharacterized protein